MKTLEIACFNFESAILALSAGADRIEFCNNYKVGGVTPTENEIEIIKNKISIPIFVMIRPRAGNFIYTEKEFDRMKFEIEFCKSHKIDGVVFGMLEDNFSIDFEKTKYLTEIAKPMSVTFHRAFDLVQNPFHELEKLISIGVDRILTSGLSDNAFDGGSFIKRFIDESGGLIKIVVGGGVRSSNLKIISELTNANEFHSSALINNLDLPDEDEIKIMKEILKNLI